MSGVPIDAAGRFAGYASLFGKPDQGGDIVMPGAFAGSLGRRGQAVRMLFQHDPKEPVGLWERIAEDRHGLWAEGRLLPGVARAAELRSLIGSGAIEGLSIGFRTVRASKSGAGLRRLWQIDLWEISIVTFPMMDGARISSATGAEAVRIEKGAHPVWSHRRCEKPVSTFSHDARESALFFSPTTDRFRQWKT